MALPFGVWDGSEAFQRAQDFEEEQDEQMYEEKLTETDDFIVRLAPTSRGLMQSMDGGRKFLKVSQLIVTSDYIGTAFVDSYLMNQGTTVKIGVVTGPFDSSPTGNTICQASLWDKTCFLYSLDGGSDTVICQMKHSMDQKFLFNWVDKVFDVIQPSSVVLLSAIPKSKFQLEEVRNSGLDALYQLQSDSCERTTIFPTLPRPNLVGDLPAAVLTHCQIKSIPAILYILATESIHFDVTAVKSFAPILNEDILNGISKNPDARVKEALKKLCKLDVPDRGFYM